MSFDTNANKRFSATYKISSNSYNEAKDIAFATALEQTVECPYSLIENTRIENTLLGNVESLEKISENCFLATCLLYTSPSPRDGLLSRMPSSA